MSCSLSALVRCCLTLNPTGHSQQFVSSHRVIISNNSIASGSQIYGVADFNGDGRPDFLISASSSSGSNVAGLMLQNSNGTFPERVVPSVPLGSTVVADVNGDGHADILTALPGPVNDHGDPLGPATLTIALGHGDGTFSVKPAINLVGDALQPSILVKDLNRDKRPDIVVVSGDQ